MILAGAEKFRAIALSHVRSSDGIFIVYDVTNNESFNNVSYNQGYEQFKNKHFNNFAEVSAKTNHNIMEIYTEFYKEIFSKNKDKVLEKRNQNKRIFETIKNEENNCKCCY